MYSTTVIPLSESTLAQQEDADMAGNEARRLTGTVKIKQRCQFEGLEGHGQRERERRQREDGRGKWWINGNVWSAWHKDDKGLK